MARVTHVKKAQQRYATKPVLDENGQQVRTPVMRNGEQIVTKRGPKWLRVTEKDLTRPLPNLRCDFPGCTIDGGEILPGTAYKWIKPKSGPYGGHQKNRHAAHPSWNVWDYSSSLSAQVARIEHEADLDGCESVEDAQAVAEQAADEIRDLAEQKRESASNIEDGFGHATYQSEELEQQADDLDSWADDVAATEFPDPEEYQEDATCLECQGSGQVDNPDWDEDDEDSDEPETIECDECNGTGENEDPETDWDEWREAAQEALAETLGNCPV